MKTDRELLISAAKAAGFTRAFYTASFSPAIMFGHHPKEGQKGIEIGNQLWNPLTDDSDALRLAVQLRMQMNVLRDSVHVTGDDYGNCGIQTGADPASDLRRAIVIVAAEHDHG